MQGKDREDEYCDGLYLLGVEVKYGRCDRGSRRRYENARSSISETSGPHALGGEDEAEGDALSR